MEKFCLSIPVGPTVNGWEGRGFTGLYTGPYFDTSTPTNITAQLGTHAFLPCKVKQLGNKSVSSSYLSVICLSSSLLLLCLQHQNVICIGRFFLPTTITSDLDFRLLFASISKSIFHHLH